ncbi:hypothetical protein [Acetomicrobium sp. S15 = DSM 107314]
MFVESQNSTVSFRYTDLLTHEVEIELLSAPRSICRYNPEATGYCAS